MFGRRACYARKLFLPSVLHAASRLLGVESVRIYHDQTLFKEPGGGHTPWHQDQTYWPLEPGSTITMWLPLAEITREVGSMYFVSGSHEMGSLVLGEYLTQVMTKFRNGLIAMTIFHLRTVLWR